MGIIFAEGTIIDELVGLGILAGMLTIDPSKETTLRFQKALPAIADICGCPLGKYGMTALAVGWLAGELARLAARELANNYIKVLFKAKGIPDSRDEQELDERRLDALDREESL